MLPCTALKEDKLHVALAFPCMHIMLAFHFILHVLIRLQQSQVADVVSAAIDALNHEAPCHAIFIFLTKSIKPRQHLVWMKHMYSRCTVANQLSTEDTAPNKKTYFFC
jgi:hypothetical protein